MIRLWQHYLLFPSEDYFTAGLWPSFLVSYGQEIFVANSGIFLVCHIEGLLAAILVLSLIIHLTGLSFNGCYSDITLDVNI